MLLLLLTACIENNLNPGKDDNEPFDSGDPIDDTGIDTDTSPPPIEECNGVDDDGDGEIDEGFNDVDADGTADCVDDACEPSEPAPRSEVDPDCEGSGTSGTPPADPWNVVIEWQHLGNGVVSTPSVGDLDGDGIPEVAVDDDKGGGRTVILNGATGAERWEIAGMDAYSGPSLGDIDNDGYGEVVTSSGSCFSPHVVYAYNHDGTKLWQTSIGSACETYANIADIDGDGSPEVIVNEYVLDGATGAVEFTLAGAASDNWGAPAVADLDLDGIPEILLSNQIFDNTGRSLWSCGTGGTGTFPHPVNADADPEGEVLIAGYGRMTLCDDTGAELWSKSYSSYGTAVAVADFDNDGMQEYAFAQSGTLALLEPDGTTRWSARVNDTSGLAGCTSWDVNYDGVPEVVYADEQDILVFDGVTGAVVIRDPNHGSWTAAETPAVADVDGDGHGELVYGSNSSGYIGVTVIGSGDDDWPYSRPVYNQYTYYGGNVEDDLTIPTYAEPPWLLEPNLFRGQPSAVFTDGSKNLRVDIADVCFASCEDDGLVSVWVQVWNDGGRTVSAGAPVDLYGRPDGLSTLVERRLLPDDLESGASVELQFDLTVTQFGTGIAAVVDGDDAVDECHEDDNSDEWWDTACP